MSPLHNRQPEPSFRQAPPAEPTAGDDALTTVNSETPLSLRTTNEPPPPLFGGGAAATEQERERERGRKRERERTGCPAVCAVDRWTKLLSGGEEERRRRRLPAMTYRRRICDNRGVLTFSDKYSGKTPLSVYFFLD
ncbi:hypothetical protein Hanom_Chr07g00624891 [Helianthus anomalus]